MPPRVVCGERAPAEPLPARPAFPPMPREGASGAEWRRYLGVVHGVWVARDVRVVGAYTAEVLKRAATAECLDREREAGRIR